MKKRTDKKYIIGYRAQGIGTYTTKIKPLGYVVAGLGYALVGFGVVTLPLPTGSVFAIGGGVALLGLVGIRLNIKRKLSDKIRLFKYKRGLI